MNRIVPAILLSVLPSFVAAEVVVNLSSNETGTLNTYELVWSSTEADQCVASGGWTGTKPTSGAEVVSITQDTTFTLTCTGPEQSTITWTPPTQRVDNTPLAPAEIGGFNIYASFDAASLELIDTADGTTTTYVLTEPQQGTRYYAVTAFDTENLESEFSAIATKDIVFPSGSAEIILIQSSGQLQIVGNTVYTVVKRVNRFLMLPVGTAPTGTLCIETERVNQYYVVPREVVTWSGTIRPDVVVAICEVQ
jgi:hypothetical protein